MPIIYLPFEALIFLAFYKVGKKHDLQKSVRETSVSVFSGSAIGVSLATIIIYSIYFMIQPVPHEMLPYYIFAYVFSIIISIIYMFFTAFAGLAMGYFRDRGKERKEDNPSPSLRIF
jgi:hypothetical protein